MSGARNNLLAAILAAAALMLGPVDCVMPSARAAQECVQRTSCCASPCELPEDDSEPTPDCPIIACVMVQRPLLRRWPPDVRAEHRALQPVLPSIATLIQTPRPRELAIADSSVALPESVDPPTLLKLGCMLLE